MILFEKDWEEYPNAIADVYTTNKSWIEYCALLKKMGVSNIWWPLQLHQPELQGVDPHDSENLTTELKTKIITECEINPFYLFREVIRIKGSGGTSPMDLHRGIGAVIWLFMNSIDHNATWQRQKGKSIVADCIRIWYTYFGTRHTTSFLFTKAPDLRSENIKSIKAMLTYLPSYLNPVDRLDVDNTEMLSCIARDNWVLTSTAKPVKERARNVGRGQRIAYTQGDEAPYIINAHISFPALYASASTAMKQAREAGYPACHQITTTAGLKDTKEGAYVYKMIQDGYYWNEHLLDCKDPEHLIEVIMKNSKGYTPFVDVTMSHRQLGISDEEQRVIVAKARPSSPDDANRDFYNVWTSGSASHPLTKQLLLAVDSSERDPDFVQFTKDNYAVRWYVPEHEVREILEKRFMVAALDTSQAIGRDDNALVFIDIRTMRPLGISNVNEANLHYYGVWIANLLIMYDKITLVPENKASGQSMMDTIAACLIQNGINPFRRIFNYIINEKTVRTDAFKEIQMMDKVPSLETYEKYKKFMGFNTTGQSRPFLYNTVLQEAASSTAHLVQDKILSKQLKGLITKNGRVDHAPGGHDDAVIAWLLGHWFVRHARHLNEYGIDPTHCLSMVSDKGALLTEEELAVRRELTKLTLQINDLKDRMCSAATPIDVERYQKMLRPLVEKAERLGETTFTMDGILNEVKESRVSKRTLRQAVKEHRRQRGMIR